MKEELTKSKFDKVEFDVSLDTDLFGQSLRARSIEISAVADQTSRLYTHCMYRQSVLQIDIKHIRYLAYQILKENEEFRKANLDIKEMMIESQTVEYNDEKTSVLEKEKQIAIYAYLVQRGKDKLKELNNNLDLARTFLSWDKQSMEKGV